MTNSNYIDWNIAKKPKRGAGNSNKNASIAYRDGTGDLSASYSINFTNSCDDSILKTEVVVFGASKNGDFFLKTKEVPNVVNFRLSKTKSSVSVYGKDLVRRAIKTLTGIDPKGDITVRADLKKISDDTFKFIDPEIQ